MDKRIKELERRVAELERKLAPSPDIDKFKKFLDDNQKNKKEYVPVPCPYPVPYYQPQPYYQPYLPPRYNIAWCGAGDNLTGGAIC